MGFGYFSSGPDHISVECKTCGKVYRLPFSRCRGEATGYTLHPPLRCKCGTSSGWVHGTEKPKIHKPGGSKGKKSSSPGAEEKAAVVGCFWFVVVVVVFSLLSALFRCGPEPDPTRGARADITVRCKDAVRAQLRAPGTADFPFGMVGQVILTNDTTAVLRSYVDAENAFGGEVRRNFRCTANRRGSVWLVDMQFTP